MTARLDVTPKTTEQNRIVCTSKSEAEGIKKTALEVLYYWCNEANYWQTRSIARPLHNSRPSRLWLGLSIFVDMLRVLASLILVSLRYSDTACLAAHPSSTHSLSMSTHSGIACIPLLKYALSVRAMLMAEILNTTRYKLICIYVWKILKW